MAKLTGIPFVLLLLAACGGTQPGIAERTAATGSTAALLGTAGLGSDGGSGDGGGGHPKCLPSMRPPPGAPIETFTLSGYKNTHMQSDVEPIQVELSGPGLSSCWTQVSCEVWLTKVKVDGSDLFDSPEIRSGFKLIARDSYQLSMSAQAVGRFGAIEVSFGFAVDWHADPHPTHFNGAWFYYPAGRAPSTLKDLVIDVPDGFCFP